MKVAHFNELREEEIDNLLNRDAKIEEAMKKAAEIISDVKKNGDEAVVKYTKIFDGVELHEMKTDRDEIERAFEVVDPELVKMLENAKEHILSFHSRQKTEDWMEVFEPGIRLGQKIVALEKIGAYVPFSYPSTALMTVIPAKVAGVGRIIVCTPPDRDGKANPLTLVAAKIAGADEVFKVGGAQAIAAMALGTKMIPRVDKIVGPGNTYVTAAKIILRSETEIDFPAGPTEIIILADHSASGKIIASDMLAQLEHENSVAILITTSKELAEVVAGEMEDEKRGMILIVSDISRGIEFVNDYAPEHLEIIVERGIEEDLISRIRNAGAIFVGGYSPVAAADYVIGNHVLPTSGWARSSSGLNVDHFVKKISVQMMNKEGLESIKDTIIEIAKAEGFERHAKSAEVRFE
jgi:histidinol dehydrogenase